MARTKATQRRSQARQRQRDARRAAIVSSAPLKTSVTAAVTTDFHSVAQPLNIPASSSDRTLDDNAAATPAAKQPNDTENYVYI